MAWRYDRTRHERSRKPTQHIRNAMKPHTFHDKTYKVTDVVLSTSWNKTNELLSRSINVRSVSVSKTEVFVIESSEIALFLLAIDTYRCGDRTRHRRNMCLAARSNASIDTSMRQRDEMENRVEDRAAIVIGLSLRHTSDTV